MCATGKAKGCNRHLRNSYFIDNARDLLVAVILLGSAFSLFPDYAMAENTDTHQSSGVGTQTISTATNQAPDRQVMMENRKKEAERKKQEYLQGESQRNAEYEERRNALLARQEELRRKQAEESAALEAKQQQFKAELAEDIAAMEERKKARQTASEVIAREREQNDIKKAELIAEIEAANEASRKESEEEARQEEILNQQKEAEKKAAEEKRRIEEEQRRADSKRRMEEYKAEFERKRAEAEANRKAQAAEQAASMKQALGLTDSKEDQELLEDAMARVQFGIEFQGARVEDMPRKLYMEMLSKEIAAMRNDPHKRKLAKTAAWLNEGHIDNQSSANDVIICKACGGRYKQLGPSMINSTPTDCIKGGDHPPNWVESYDDSTVFTCPSCDGRFTSMTSGMINSTPTDCPGGGKHDPRWVPSN